MKNYTDITVLLDRSGSMQTIREAMISGFDEFVKGHKAVPSTRLTLVQFDGVDPQETIYTGRPIGDVPGLELTPRGMTPLFDAICRAVDDAGRRFKHMPEAERPERVLFVVITDGLENASRSFKREDVKNRITKQTDDYSWQFMYIGANQDAITEAATFGINENHAINFAYASAGASNSMRSLTKNTVGYASGGGAATLDWSELQRSEAMEGEKKEKK
jgi:hypothetical protein